MRNWKNIFAAVVAGSLVFTAGAQAAFLVDVSILGSTTNGSGYSSSLSGLTSGETVYLEVVGQLAPVNTVNGSKTITSLSNTKDGITSLNFGLALTGGGTFSNIGLATAATTPATKGTLSTGGSVSWTGTGSQPGTIGSNAVTSIVPNTGGGADTGTVPSASDVLWFGQLSLGSSTTSTIGGSWTTGGSGSFKINGGSNTFITNTTETGANPLVGFSGLTLTEGQAAANKIISLTNSAPTGYGASSLATLAVTGTGATGYVPASKSLVPAVQTGFVEGKGFSPASDTEIYGLDITENGAQASPSDIAALVADINGSNTAGGAIASASLAGDPFAAGYNLFLTFPSALLPAVQTGDNFLGFDLSQAANVDGGAATVSAVAVVPEPATFSLLGLAAAGFLARRRTNRSI